MSLTVAKENIRASELRLIDHDYPSTLFHHGALLSGRLSASNLEEIEWTGVHH
ncbi:hypothetical protein M758_UG139500 [Ceratodon purpureus]|nr:hypothetical protein M758_UG139500 [Ceratodon purpureus]